MKEKIHGNTGRIVLPSKNHPWKKFTVFGDKEYHLLSELSSVSLGMRSNGSGIAIKKENAMVNLTNKEARKLMRILKQFLNLKGEL